MRKLRNRNWFGEEEFRDVEATEDIFLSLDNPSMMGWWCIPTKTDRDNPKYMTVYFKEFGVLGAWRKITKVPVDGIKTIEIGNCKLEKTFRVLITGRNDDPACFLSLIVGAQSELEARLRKENKKITREKELAETYAEIIKEGKYSEILSNLEKFSRQYDKKKEKGEEDYE